MGFFSNRPQAEVSIHQCSRLINSFDVARRSKISKTLYTKLFAMYPFFSGNEFLELLISSCSLPLCSGIETAVLCFTRGENMRIQHNCFQPVACLSANKLLTLYTAPLNIFTAAVGIAWVRRTDSSRESSSSLHYSVNDH